VFCGLQDGHVLPRKKKRKKYIYFFNRFRQFAGETAVELIMVDDPMCKAIVDKLLGETIVVSEGKSADASLVQSSKPTSVGKQRHLLDELLSTEDSYLNHLKILKTVISLAQFKTPDLIEYPRRSITTS